MQEEDTEKDGTANETGKTGDVERNTCDGINKLTDLSSEIKGLCAIVGYAADSEDIGGAIYDGEMMDFIYRRMYSWAHTLDEAMEEIG